MQYDYIWIFYHFFYDSYNFVNFSLSFHCRRGDKNVSDNLLSDYIFLFIPRNPRQHVKHPAQVQASVSRVCQVSVTNFLRFFQGESLGNRMNSLGVCRISVKLFSRIASYSLPLWSIYSLMTVSGFCVEFRLHLVYNSFIQRNTFFISQS